MSYVFLGAETIEDVVYSREKQSHGYNALVLKAGLAPMSLCELKYEGKEVQVVPTGDEWNGQDALPLMTVADEIGFNSVARRKDKNIMKFIFTDGKMFLTILEQGSIAIKIGNPEADFDIVPIAVNAPDGSIEKDTERVYWLDAIKLMGYFKDASDKLCAARMRGYLDLTSPNPRTGKRMALSTFEAEGITPECVDLSLGYLEARDRERQMREEVRREREIARENAKKLQDKFSALTDSAQGKNKKVEDDDDDEWSVDVPDEDEDDGFIDANDD